jgi:uncharacterized protein (DUF1800 family)
MSGSPKREAGRDSWGAYVPSDNAPWNLRRVVHLHRRAGFAATWAEMQRDLKDGPQRSVDRILAGRVRTQGVPDDFSRTADILADAARAVDNLNRLQAWWIYRMIFTPDPLGERLTLFWHNHFATSAAKVGFAVQRQNGIFRRLGRGRFGELLGSVVRDPAILLWLDAQANRRGNPNENLARELMELFTLGIGHYTETDVREAARALTGWTVVDGQFREDTNLHDAGQKTILGRTGAWQGAELLNILLDHSATAERLARRICELLLGESPIDADAIRALASGLRERNLDIGWAVETVLRSRTFFAEASLGSRVLGPVEYVVGAVRALELFDPCPNTLVLTGFMRGLGQDLFYPPNVGGWPGGRAWLSTRSIIGRHNLAMALVGGNEVGLLGPFDALGLARRHGRATDLETLVGFYAELLLGRLPSTPWRDRIIAALGAKSALEPRTARTAVALILASPEAQLT